MGVPVDDASIVADTMVEANLRGVDSHGVRHLGGYTRAVRGGMANSHPEVRVVSESGGIAVWDGDSGLGQVACSNAMRTAVDRAHVHGYGAVAIRNSTHSGMVGYYPTIAARAGCVGFTTSSGTRSNPPFGGVTPLLGGVFAYAIPTSGDPIILDTVCTNVRPAKLRELAESGSPIPPDWATDEEGRPTEDAMRALGGFRQWMGGPRGSGLAVVMHTLASVLSGGPVGMEMPAYASTGSPTPNVVKYGAERQAHFVSALNVETFLPRQTFEARVDGLVDDIRSSETAPGVDSVMAPGDPEWTTRSQRTVEGIPISIPLWDELRGLRTELRVDAWLTDE